MIPRPFTIVAICLAAVAWSPLARADEIYLFAGDRVPNPARAASLHRYRWDPQATQSGVPAPAAGLGDGLWGATGSADYKGLDFSGVTLASNGDFYAVSNSVKKVFRIDGKTGAYKGVVMSDLKSPDGIATGPDGNIYVADYDKIRRCDLQGKPLPGAEQVGNVFAAGGSLGTAAGLVFGPDGNLYVSSQNWQRIVRYDGRTGEYIDVFQRGDVSSPTALAFGPDGNLYVACVGGPRFDAESGSVAKLDGKTGDLIGTFAIDAKGALGLAFAPNGNLLVSNYWSGKISQFDGKTGAFLGVFAEPPAGTAFYTLLFAKSESQRNDLLKPLR